ncbi:A24 family peptidase [Thalassotalea nanhaiensis]|uniref:A24 family peptidase n=1 Tax=Thalassotalea nanhaiensis TaxID=3065648 RepID=A0ABY9TGB5_9GAMM|nr:A24 family peptidase [Colwelliaceae bacterium SQ345]
MILDASTSLVIMLLIAIVCLVIALYFDLKYQKIPNSLCLVFIFIALVLQLLFYRLQGGLDLLFGVVLAFILLFPAFYIKALGGGDVKLMMAIGALCGPLLIAWSIAYAIIFGGIISIFLGINKSGWAGLKQTLIRYYHCFYLKQYFKPSTGEVAELRVPYAPALALGWIWACSQSDEVMLAISTFRYQFFS